MQSQERKVQEIALEYYPLKKSAVKLEKSQIKNTINYFGGSENRSKRPTPSKRITSRYKPTYSNAH